MLVSMHNDKLANRAMSSFPISIGTSLALESIFNPMMSPYDPNREIPNRVELKNYQSMFFNLSTMFRNLQGSMDKDTFLDSDPKELLDVLQYEIDVIKELFNIEGNGITKPEFYICTYETYYTKAKYQNVQFRKDITDFQKIYTFKLTTTLNELLKNNKEFKKFDIYVTSNDKNALILSHMPCDLLSHKNFNRLDLLESHTGKLKHRYQWSTKYLPTTVGDLTNFPFMRKFLMVFGDKILIKPADIRLRKQLVEIANKRRWTPMTTLEKVNLDLELDIKEPFILHFLKEIE